MLARDLACFVQVTTRENTNHKIIEELVVTEANNVDPNFDNIRGRIFTMLRKHCDMGERSIC